MRIESRSRTGVFFWALVFGATAALSSGASAQSDEEARQHGIFIDTVDVSLIGLEVFASLDGEPVTDLDVDDFEILDDGQPVQISHFSKVDRQPPASGAGSLGGEEQIEAEAELAPEERSTVIILVDQLFVSSASRKQVFEAATQQLERLIAAGAQVMVVGKTREISVEQGFTSNPALVRLALDRLSQSAPSGYANEMTTLVELWDITPAAAESRQVGPGQSPAALTTSELDAQSALQDARGLSQRIHADVSASLATLDQFLDSLAGVPGRKALIYVADRLPVRPAELVWRIWWEKYGLEHGSKLGVGPTGPTDLDLSRPLEALISDANASRVAFYPVGTGAGVNLSAASSRGLKMTTGAASRTTESASGDGLRWLSTRSGGRAAVRTASLDGLFDGLARDLSSYYSISYVSPHRGDGEVHRVEIRVARPGVELRHPTEYRDKSSSQRTTDRTMSTLTLGVEDNALDVRVTVGKARRQGGSFSVPVAIKVPMANLVLLPDTASHRGKLSIQLIARDSRGRFSDPVLVRMPFEVNNRDVAWALSQTVDYEAEMTLERGSYEIAVDVHDDLGFTGSTVGVDVDVGSSR